MVVSSSHRSLQMEKARSFLRSIVNPSALHFLFAPLEFTTATWSQVVARPEIFLAKGHAKPFLGFADDQMKRLLGQKGQKNMHRAEPEEMHGYDTKYAMRVIWLYGEA
jgi:uncharacterized protein